MNLPGGSELILIFIVVMVLFGYKKLPDATRSLGQSMRIFKAEAKGLRDEPEKTVTATPAQVQAAQVVQQAPVVDPAPVVPAAPVQAPPAHAAAAPVAEQAPYVQAPATQP